MTLYLDASVLVSLFVDDSHTERARNVLTTETEATTSLWAVTEFSSALARLVRMAVLPIADRDQIEAQFDQWLIRLGSVAAPIPEDFISARLYLRNSRSGLRGPDALHLAFAARSGFTLVTFDEALIAAAAEFGVATLS